MPGQKTKGKTAAYRRKQNNILLTNQNLNYYGKVHSN